MAYPRIESGEGAPVQRWFACESAE